MEVDLVDFLLIHLEVLHLFVMNFTNIVPVQMLIFCSIKRLNVLILFATQSYSSLLNSINNQYAVKVIIQNLINKFWFRTDDINTIDDIQKQIGKEDKIKISKSISESAKETHYSYFTNSLNSKNSNLSESINEYIQNDFIYDTNFLHKD